MEKKSLIKKCMNVIRKAIVAYFATYLVLTVLILVTMILGVDLKPGLVLRLVLDGIWILLTVLFVKKDWKLIPKRKEKKPKAEAPKPSAEAPVITDLNTRWIEKAAVFSGTPWSRVEYLLTGRYGYDLMLKLLQTAVDHAERTDHVWTAELSGMPEIDRTEDFRKANCKVSDCPQLQQECGQLSAGLFVQGFSPLKIVFLNQTNLVRILVASEMDETLRLKLDRYLEEILEMALNGNIKPHVERLLDSCAKAISRKEPADKLKNQLGRRLLAVDKLYVMMDEDFNNRFPYLDVNKSIYVFLNAKLANKAAEDLRDKIHVSVKEITGIDLAQFAVLGAKGYRLFNDMVRVDISFKDYINADEKCLLGKENTRTRINLLMELQFGYRIRNLSEEARGSDHEKILIKKCSVSGKQPMKACQMACFMYWPMCPMRMVSASTHPRLWNGQAGF